MGGGEEGSSPQGWSNEQKRKERRNQQEMKTKAVAKTTARFRVQGLGFGLRENGRNQIGQSRIHPKTVSFKVPFRLKTVLSKVHFRPNTVSSTRERKPENRPKTDLTNLGPSSLGPSLPDPPLDPTAQNFALFSPLPLQSSLFLPSLGRLVVKL